MREINRLIRHAVAPLVMWLVAKGYLPEYMQADVVEALVLGVAIGAPLAVSWWRDRGRA